MSEVLAEPLTGSNCQRTELGCNPLPEYRWRESFKATLPGDFVFQFVASPTSGELAKTSLAARQIAGYRATLQRLLSYGTRQAVLYSLELRPRFGIFNFRPNGENQLAGSWHSSALPARPSGAQTPAVIVQ